MSRTDLETPATLTTALGDTACLTYDRLDPAAIEASVRSSQSGAVVSFVGYTRDNFQGRQVTHLVYESYVSLALKTMGQILEEARNLPPPPPLEGSAHHCCPPPALATPSDDSTGIPTSTSSQAVETPRIEVNRIHVAHLLGPSPPLTPSIVITVASPHRREAFWLTEWLLERVKERVQVWKREYYAPESSTTTTLFVGRDGDGPDGRGGRGIAVQNQSATRDSGRDGEGGSRWKENFKPVRTVGI
ncbi:molybdopterin synthase catalytic subunit [Sporobolomyces salmoneus]|uniref:molybdopterin synthase catalytic subunit n=1 Tax=Sporobolomyces salmoneus TaxID=183962 RepID=UPI00317D7928